MNKHAYFTVKVPLMGSITAEEVLHALGSACAEYAGSCMRPVRPSVASMLSRAEVKPAFKHDAPQLAAEETIAYWRGHTAGKADTNLEAARMLCAVVYAATSEHVVVVPPHVLMHIPNGTLERQTLHNGSIRYTAKLGAPATKPAQPQPQPRRVGPMFADDEGDAYGWREVDWQEALNPDEGDKG